MVMVQTSSCEREQAKHSVATYILVLLVLLIITDFPVWSTLWSIPK